MKSNVQKELVEWRRSQALSMYAKGKTMSAIAEILKVDVATVSRDLSHLRNEAIAKQGEYISNLPYRHKLAISNLDSALSELWVLYEQETDTRTKKAILDSISDVVIKQQIVLGDPQQIDKALKAVAKIKEQLQQQNKEEATTA